MKKIIAIILVASIALGFTVNVSSSSNFGGEYKIYDALTVLMYMSDMTELSDAEFRELDTDCNGELDIDDAVVILMIIAEMVFAPECVCPVYRRITPQKAKQMLDENGRVVLLDVRRADEFAADRIPGAINLPHTEVEAKAATILPDKGAVILVYCLGGVRSEIASRALVNLGYYKVYDFGGINSWPYDKEIN